MRGLRFSRQRKAALVQLLQLLGITLAALLLTKRAQAFTQVTISTGAPLGLETSFLASTTNQFLSKLVANPLVPNTYSLLLYGPNPSYNPPPTNQQLLNALVSVDSFTYVYGWAGGVSYQQSQEEGSIGFLGNLCGSPTSFMLLEASTATFNTSTCQDVISTIMNNLFDEQLSTTPVLGF